MSSNTKTIRLKHGGPARLDATQVIRFVIEREPTPWKSGHDAEIKRKERESAAVKRLLDRAQQARRAAETARDAAVRAKRDAERDAHAREGEVQRLLKKLSEQQDAISARLHDLKRDEPTSVSKKIPTRDEKDSRPARPRPRPRVRRSASRPTLRGMFPPYVLDRFRAIKSDHTLASLVRDELERHSIVKKLIGSRSVESAKSEAKSDKMLGVV